MAQVLTHNQTYSTPQDALLHYGVKGMRWGVRNEDRPAGSSGPSAKQVKRDVKAGALEARAAKANIRAREIKTELAKTPGGIKTYNKRATLKNELTQVEGYRDHLNKTAEQVRNGKMTRRQKQLLVGGAIVGGLILVGYGQTKMESGELNALKLRGRAALQRKPFDFNRNESLAGKMSADDVLANVVPGINPNYKKPGGQMNCRRCTFAYELRRRGYDVEATTSALGYGQSETGLLNALSPGKRNVNRATSLSSMVVSGAQGIRTKASGDTRKNTADIFHVPDANSRKSFLDTLRQQPDGARGEAVFNFGAFGHSLAYERFGDKTYIFDTQKGLRYSVDNEDSYRSFLDKWGSAGIKNIEVTRLDNLDLDNNFLARWATNRKDG